MRVAACQVNSRGDRAANLVSAMALLDRAADAGADVAVLPEYVDYLGPAEGEPKPEPVDGEFATVLGDRARARAMGEAGRRRAEREFSVDRALDIVEAMYRRARA